MKAKFHDLTKSMDGKWILSLALTEDPRELLDEVKEFLLDVTIRKFSSPRSLRANRYAWELIDQITTKMQQKEPWVRWTPTMVYRNAIRDIGGVSEFLGMKTAAVEYFKRNWEHGHVGRQVVVLDGEQASDKPGWSNVKIYYGSSDFNTEQMARFVNSLIQDAEALGIPTITPQEEKKIVEMWGKRHESTKPATG